MIDGRGSENRNIAASLPIVSNFRAPPVLYGVALIAILVAGISVFVATPQQDLLSARVLSGPTDAVGVCAGRVQLLRERSGVLLPAADLTFRFIAIQGSHRYERTKVSDSEGWSDFSFPRRPREPLQIRIIHRGQILGAGQALVSTQHWISQAERRGPSLEPLLSAPVRLDLRVESGALSVPFESQLTMTAVSPSPNALGEPLAGASLSLAGDGLEVLSKKRLMLDKNGFATIALRPTHHVATLELRVKSENLDATLERSLPVVPGAFMVSLGHDAVLVSSSLAREHAYFTVLSEDARLLGGRVELRPFPGGTEGEIPWRELPPRKGKYLMIASDGDALAPSTVGFPLDGQAQTWEAWDELVIDGPAQVRERHARQRKRVRWVLGGYAALSGIVVLLLFFLTVRKADAELVDRLSSVGAAPPHPAPSQKPLVIALLCLFFAFSAAVLWIVSR